MREIDFSLLQKLKEAEDDRFASRHPRSKELLKRGRQVMPNGVPMSWLKSNYENEPVVWASHAAGSRFTDADGHTYSDFNIADMSMFCGYNSEPIILAVDKAMRKGNQFLLPTEDAITVSQELARRYGLPKWQYTSSASQANVEAIRVARVATGREKVLFFDGKYNGHFDEGLIILEGEELKAEEHGIPAFMFPQTVIVPFNDIQSLEAALRGGDIALVLTEPALTNNVGLLLPKEGFHDKLRKLTRAAGVLLCIDETHTQVVGPGGLTKEWNLQPDLVTLGKSIAAGVPLGAWGMTNEIAAIMESTPVATGGTLFGNPLSLAAARAALFEVLTPQAYNHTQSLAEKLAQGLQQIIAEADLPWRVDRLGPRVNLSFANQLPQNAAQARAIQNPLLSKLIRIWLANRGVWDALLGAGPTVAVPAQQEDIETYVKAFRQLITSLSSD